MSALRAGRCINGSRRNRVEDRLFITVWYRVSATLTSRMKGCRAAPREPAAAGVRDDEGEERGSARVGVKRG